MMHLPMGSEQSYPTSTPDGSDRPIACASCTLSKSGQNYAQIEKRGWLSYSRRQYKVSVPLKKKRCPTAYQRLKKRNCLPFLWRLYDHKFTRHFQSSSAQIHQ